MNVSPARTLPTRSDLLLSGLGLLGGFVCAAIAAFTPPSSVWTTGGSHAVALIAQHLDEWQRANWFFGAGIVATLAGMAALAVLLGRPAASSAPSLAALTLMIVASTLWMVNLTARLTVTWQVAQQFAAGSAIPQWYEAFERWADNALLAATGLVGGTAMVFLGLSPAPSALFPGWTMWTTAALGALLVAEVVLTHDVIPALLYLAPTPLGATALWRAIREQGPTRDEVPSAPPS
jgi:hypothetical protein